MGINMLLAFGEGKAVSFLPLLDFTTSLSAWAVAATTHIFFWHLVPSSLLLSPSPIIPTRTVEEKAEKFLARGRGEERSEQLSPSPIRYHPHVINPWAPPPPPSFTHPISPSTSAQQTFEVWADRHKRKWRRGIGDKQLRNCRLCSASQKKEGERHIAFHHFHFF